MRNPAHLVPKVQECTRIQLLKSDSTIRQVRTTSSNIPKDFSKWRRSQFRHRSCNSPFKSGAGVAAKFLALRVRESQSRALIAGRITRYLQLVEALRMADSTAASM